MPVSDLASEQQVEHTRAESVRRVKYGAWLIKLVAWDGFVPLIVLLLPSVVEELFPNRRGAMELTALTVPIAAFFIRFVVGKRHIYANDCTDVVRCMQLVALCLAILLLVLIDTLIILANLMPKGAMFATPVDWLVWAVLIGVYGICMAFAMFPGRTVQETSVV